MTTETHPDFGDEDETMDFTDCLGDSCLSIGDVVCLKSGGFMMTVEHLISDDAEDEFAEGHAFCAWAKDDETIARDSFRTEMLDNVTLEDAAEDLSDEVLDALSERADETPTH